MRKLTVLLFALFLLGCPPSKHQHPELQGTPRASEIKNTHSGIIWRIVHTPDGAKSFVTKTPEGWLWYEGSHYTIVYVPDKNHLWLNNLNLKNGHFDAEGNWISNTKALKVQLPDGGATKVEKD